MVADRIMGGWWRRQEPGASRQEKQGSIFFFLLSPVSCLLFVHFTSNTNSTSTDAPSGSVFTPTAALTCLPASPKSWIRKSLAPLATCGCCVKSESEFTNAPTRTTPTIASTPPPSVLTAASALTTHC